MPETEPHLLRTICLSPHLRHPSFSALPSSLKANPLHHFCITTGSKAGVYYPIGSILAECISERGQRTSDPLAGTLGVVYSSAGSVENASAIATKEVEAGFIQADIAAFAYEGRRMFKDDAHHSLRALASLYPEQLQIVVTQQSNIANFQELHGKKISLDEFGSGTLVVMRTALEAYGMKEQELKPFYLKPDSSLRMIIERNLDGFVIMAGTPIQTVTELIPLGINLIGIDPLVAARIHHSFPYLYQGTIPADIYGSNDPVPTLEVYALLVVNENLSDAIAYALLETLFDGDTALRLKKGHPQGHSITLESALRGISIPLHPGAVNYYKDHHMMGN